MTDRQLPAELEELLEKIMPRQEWMEEVQEHAEGGLGASLPDIWAFPSDSLLDAYLQVIATRPEPEVLGVLESLLIPSTATGGDHLRYEFFCQVASSEKPEDFSTYLRLESDPFVKRIVRYYAGVTDEPPREGLRWVLRLLPDRPRLALQALDVYTTANLWELSDKMIHALGDAEAIIRGYFIGTPATAVERVKFLLDETDWREFEQVVEHLYDAMGYKTELTPRSGDKGRDVVARRSDNDYHQTVYIQCKRYTKKRISSDQASSLGGRINQSEALRGVLVTTSSFEPAALEHARIDQRIELIDGPNLILLMNEHLGFNWPNRINQLKSSRPYSTRSSASSPEVGKSR
ncbi:restriction endonuclease [Actinoplanes sp. G11-F43]|uniref:restriction endonuclease n=1 Tax=Actinoplanes sp. G11-F43 TaxID=3424130 RepID=UPI003D329FFB